jgi:histidinol-phosphate aminotransferase
VYGLAGIRLGYAIGDPDLLAPLYRIKEPFSVNSLAQAAGIAALEDPGCLEASVENNRIQREYLYREFDRMELFYVRSHTNFILVQVGPAACEIVDRLLMKGVIIRPCSGYDLPDFLRITLGTQAENARLIQALEQVLEEIHQTQPG